MTASRPDDGPDDSPDDRVPPGPGDRRPVRMTAGPVRSDVVGAAEPTSSPILRGGPTDAEVAAVLATLRRRSPAPTATAYERWRRTRLSALRGRGRSA